MSGRGRPGVNVDMDDFFDEPMHVQHKTTTFTMSTKSSSGDRDTAGDFQPPCPSERKDTDRGEILTITTMSSDSQSDTESHAKKKTNSARNGSRSQRSATSSKTGRSNSSRNSDSETDDDTGSDSCDDGEVVVSGRRTPSPRKSPKTKSDSRLRNKRSTTDHADSHKHAWGTDSGDRSKQAVERPKTAHQRRVKSQEGNNWLQSHSRDSRSQSRSCSSDSRSRSRSRSCDGSSRSRSRSRDNSSRSRSGSESSSCSSLTSSDTDASDVTDVSPLNSPAHKVTTSDMHRWEQCQLGAKPPRSPANKGGSSQRSRSGSATSTLGSCRENLNLLQANSDTMDLKFLMHAVMEMEREKDRGSSTDHQVFFQPGGSKSAKQWDSRQNFSFTNDKVRNIDTENQRLMHQILKYTAKKKMGPKSETSQATGEELVIKKRQTTTTAVSHLTPSAINRMREQRRIERENQAMLKRLQKTRPTRTLQRDSLLEDYNKQLLAGLSIAAYHPPLKATRSKLRPGSTSASIYTNSATSLRSDFGSTPSTGGSRRPQSATLASRQTLEKRQRPLSATTRPLSAKSPGKVRPLSATVSRKVTRQRPKPAWEPGW